MLTMIGNLFCGFCLTTAAALMLLGWWKAIKWSMEEAQRAELRRSTAAAMRYDKHIAKLRRQGMRVQVRRARG